MPETQKSICEWADTAFGKATSNLRIFTRMLEEVGELQSRLTADDNSELAAVEMADVEIVLRRLAENMGVDLQAEVDKKMAINRKREWTLDGEGQGYHESAMSDERTKEIYSVIRTNLLTIPGYTPRCGMCSSKTRTKFDVDKRQFVCTCGWQSGFPKEFMLAYLQFRIDSQKCSKCGVTVGENKSKYCGDGTDKDNPHRWVMHIYTGD